jgi:V-type H+-transporting ATPase subunit d
LYDNENESEFVGGTTFEIMGHILMREADFRVLSVTLNTLNTSLGTSLGLQDRNALYPSFGYLYPAGIMC